MRRTAIKIKAATKPVEREIPDIMRNAAWGSKIGCSMRRFYVDLKYFFTASRKKLIPDFRSVRFQVQKSAFPFWPLSQW